MSQNWIDIISTPIPVSEAVAFVSDPAAGGICVFLGTTRADTVEGRAIVALEYEAYPEMALSEMNRLASEARSRWPVLRLVMLHRLGRVAVTEPSVAIVVSTPHRAESFAASRWLIDSVKDLVPIWKKEVFDDGSGTWVHPEKPSPSA